MRDYDMIGQRSEAPIQDERSTQILKKVARNNFAMRAATFWAGSVCTGHNRRDRGGSKRQA